MPSSSSSSTIPATTAAADERDRKRKRVSEPLTDGTRTRQHAPCKWRTRREHEIYSTRLLDALRLVRAGARAVLPPTLRAREVRDAADRALAVAARGRSRWSRALLLASRSRSRARLLRAKARAPAPAPAPMRRRQSTDASSSISPPAPALARKAKELGRLVPGCRKLPFPALLSEASDYIAALEMQVRAMAALAQALSSVAPPSSLPRP